MLLKPPQYRFVATLLLSIALLVSCDDCELPNECNAVRFAISAPVPTPFDSVVLVGKGKFLDGLKDTSVANSVRHENSFFFDPTLSESIFLVHFPNRTDTLQIKHTYIMKYSDCNDYFFELEEADVLKNTLQNVQQFTDLPCAYLELWY
jgi:hypothetical protein